MTSAREYFLNVIAQGLSRAVSMGAAFVALVLFARVLGTDAFGRLAFLMAFVMLAGVLAELGTTGALAKGLAEEKERDPKTYLGNYLVLRAILAGIAILVAIPIAILVRPDMIELLLISSIAIPFIGGRVFETVYQIYGRPLYSVYTSIFLGIAQISAAVILLLVYEAELKGYMYGFVAVQFAYFLLTVFFLLQLVAPRFKIQKQTLRNIIVLAAPMGIWSIFNAISTRADIFMLSYLRTTNEVGIYNAAYRLLDLGTAVAATLAVPLVPVLSRKFGSDPKAMRTTAARAFEVTMICTLPVPLLLLFVASPLVEFIYGEAFRESAKILPVFGWLFSVLVLIYVGSAINLSADNIRHASWNAAIAAVLNIAANLYLIPRYGVLGAAWSSVTSTVFMLVVTLVYVRISVGNVFVFSKWLRIIIAALIAYLYLLVSSGDNIAIRVLVFGVLYLSAILLFRLLPFEYLAHWKRN